MIAIAAACIGAVCLLLALIEEVGQGEDHPWLVAPPRE